jgi:hypothetical protein
VKMVAANLRLARLMTNCRSNSIQNALGASILMIYRLLVAKWMNLQTMYQHCGQICDAIRAGQIIGYGLFESIFLD